MQIRLGCYTTRPGTFGDGYQIMGEFVLYQSGREHSYFHKIIRRLRSRPIATSNQQPATGRRSQPGHNLASCPFECPRLAHLQLQMQPGTYLNLDVHLNPRLGLGHRIPVSPIVLYYSHSISNPFDLHRRSITISQPADMSRYSDFW